MGGWSKEAWDVCTPANPFNQYACYQLSLCCDFFLSSFGDLLSTRCRLFTFFLRFFSGFRIFLVFLSTVHVKWLAQITRDGFHYSHIGVIFRVISQQHSAKKATDRERENYKIHCSCVYMLLTAHLSVGKHVDGVIFFFMTGK